MLSHTAVFTPTTLLSAVPSSFSTWGAPAYPGVSSNVNFSVVLPMTVQVVVSYSVPSTALSTDLCGAIQPRILESLAAMSISPRDYVLVVGVPALT